MIEVPPHVQAEMEAHAAAEFPREACGLVAVENNVAVKFFPARNVAEHPEHEFALAHFDPEIEALEARGCEIGLFHSHPSSPATISRADWYGAREWQDKPYFVLSLTTGELRSARL